MRAQVPVRTMEEREARLADAAVRAREAAQRAEQLWADALQVGWNSGFCASVETVSRWHVDVLHRFEAACKREVDNASFAALVRIRGHSTAVKAYFARSVLCLEPPTPWSAYLFKCLGTRHTIMCQSGD